jgi:uncharacterized protein YjbJ (UPF0337 family)
LRPRFGPAQDARFHRPGALPGNPEGAFALIVMTTPKRQETMMNKDRVQGAAEQVKGSVKEAAGKITGDRKTEAEGKVEKTVGKAQSAIGRAKENVEDALDE